MIRHGSQKIRLYSFMSFTKQKLPKPVELGEPWDLTVYPHSTWFKLFERPPSASATYGTRGSGMPITFFFKERPPLLYEVQTDHDYFTTAMKQHLVLVADKKAQELVLLNVSTGEKKTGRVRGSVLKTGNDAGGNTFEARNAVVALSNPERIVIWNGQHLCFYGVQNADCVAKFELKQDFVGISPDIEISRYTEQFVTCGFLSYSASLNAVLVIFGLNETRLLYIIDAVDGVVLSVTNLPKFIYSTSLEDVEVDECGLTYYREFADSQPNCMEFYALQDLPSLLPELVLGH
ncbi:hypothetical protein RvY_10782 [Ramazzottius varieornatus]|uniref:Uncharacterized protein n=1 Tax=Ramazzottius varieornatus TaxID=947166 RepID=A0A1D1VDX3_RAMVA|nr:hypothetical protein RvY_10782 [Ramazzottius varieornatus]